MRNKDVFYSGDIIQITGKNVKEKYRGLRGEVIRWHHDNVYTVKIYLTLSDIEVVLYSSEMILVQ